MKSLKFLFFVCSVTILLYGCPPSDCTWTLNFMNNTNDTLVVTYGIKKKEQSKYWTVSSEFPKISFYEEIEPDGGRMLDFPEISCKYVKVSPEDTISVFILSPDTLKKYSWEVIGSEHKYLKKITRTMREYNAEEIDYYFHINDDTQ